MTRASGALMPAMLASALALASAGPVAGQELRYSGSVGYYTGSYIFGDRTESVAVLNGLSLSRGRLSLTATLPLIAQTSTSVSFLGGGMMPTGGPDHGEVTQGHAGGMSMGDGFDVTPGDPVVRVSYRVVQGVSAPRVLTVEALAKAPVAPLSSGIGTGAWDVGVGASGMAVLGGTMVLGALSVWSPGDLPELVLREYADVTLGLGRVFAERWSLVVSVNAATTIVDSLAAPASLGVSAGLRTEGGGSWSLAAAAGLTEASPELSLTLGWAAPPWGVR